MKKGSGKFKLIGGLLAGMLLGGVTVVGANQAIQALQNTEVKISLDGDIQEFKDELTGETQYPITYHDRTYLPLRNVAQLSGLNIDYDNSNNTVVLNSTNSSNLNNTLSYNEMVEELKLTVYSNLELSQRDPHQGTLIDNFIFDIDNNNVPEIIYIGNSILAQPEDCFQVFTLKDNKVVSTIHEYSLIYATANIFQTDKGVYVYYVSGDGPETYKGLYKLNLNGLELTKKEVLYSIEIDPNAGLDVKSTYRVDGIETTKELFNEKIDGLRDYNVIKKLSNNGAFNDLWK